jgi:uncharacterized membrane protein
MAPDDINVKKSSLIVFGNKRLLAAVLVIQVALLGVIGLNAMGLNLLLIQGIIGFIYLTFIPGILILRLLNVDICKLTNFLYAIGISVIFIILIGLSTNLIYPLFSINDPLSTGPMLVTITVIITLLCFLVYKQNNTECLSFNADDLFSLNAPYLFLLILPFLTLVGAYATHYYFNNIILLFVLTILAIVPFFVAFDKIPKKLFPLAVFVIFLSLLFHNSLSVPYTAGRDLTTEYYYANLANLNGIWIPGSAIILNSVVDNIMLGPIYSKLLGIDLTLILKTLYPFLFALVALILYQVFKKQTNDKIAFFSCFFFASIGVNYEELLATLKHPISVFFISLFILLMVDADINLKKRAFLAILFITGLVFAHYGVPYVFMFSSLAALVLIRLAQGLGTFRIKKPLTSYYLFAFFASLLFSWSLYTSGSTGFDLIVKLVDTIFKSLLEFFSPIERGGIFYSTIVLPGIGWEILRILHFITIFLILVGFASKLLEKLKNKEKGSNFNTEYFFYSVAFLGWLAASIIVPTIVGGHSLGTARMYGLGILFLAPFCILGWQKMVTSAYSLLKILIK